jgi:hypothetical protein
VPHLSHRKYIYDWQPESEISLSTDYVIIDLAFLGYLPDESTRDKLGEYFRKAQNTGYKKVFVNSKETFFILHNPGNDNTYIKSFRGNLGI